MTRWDEQKPEGQPRWPVGGGGVHTSAAHHPGGRQGFASPRSGYATPQSGDASPRSGYASPRSAQRGRRPLVPQSSLSRQPSLKSLKSLSAHAASGSASATAASSRSATPHLHPPHHVPTDVIIEILQHYARVSPSCAVNALLVSKHLSPALEEAVYANVSLFSAKGMDSFQSLVKKRPEVGRRVKALWIAPGRLNSDLIPALAPPTSNAANDARQRKVQALAREILRACRRLDHLALDGGFLTPQSAVGFGTACKPKTLLCVNPHSFLGHFSAPIFRTTVKRLEIVDTTLAVEEVDEIRQMQGLEAFVWTSPRANSDVTRDVSVLLRILSPRAADAAAAADESALSSDARLIEILAASGNAPPDRSRQNEKLRTICTATSHARAAALAASFKKVVENITIGDDHLGPHFDGGDGDEDGVDDIVRAMRAVKAGGGVYVDSAMSNSTALHGPTGVEIQTEALSSLMHALTVASRRGRSSARQHAGQHRRKATAQDLDGAGSDSDSASDTDSDSDSNDDDDDDDDDNDDDEVVDEWEALRDVICQRRTANSTSSSRFFAGVGSSASSMSGSGLLVRSTASGVATTTSGGGGTTPAPASGFSTPAVGWGSASVSHAASRASSPAIGGSVGGGSDDVDGGRALQRVWRRWRTQVNASVLERFV